MNGESFPPNVLPLTLLPRPNLAGHNGDPKEAIDARLPPFASRFLFSLSAPPEGNAGGQASSSQLVLFAPRSPSLSLDRASASASGARRGGALAEYSGDGKGVGGGGWEK